MYIYKNNNLLWFESGSTNEFDHFNDNAEVNV